MDIPSVPTIESPPEIVRQKIQIEESQINAYFEVIGDNINMKWKNPSDGSYSLSLKKSESDDWDIYYGGHYTEYAPVDLNEFGLTGNEILTGRFSKYALDRSWVETYSEFDIDLSSKKVIPRPEKITVQIEESQIRAYYEIGSKEIDIRWTNPEDGSYSLSLKKSDSEDWNIYYGGHYTEYAPVDFGKFNLNGDEILIGRFTKYALNNSFVEQYSEFSIDLSNIEFPSLSQIGEASNKISYTFSDDFPSDAETKYREFLKSVLPIMYNNLGPPAETFNLFIKNMGQDTGYFMVVDNGRTFLTDTDFIPRLIVHELIHAWKGKFAITNDENWEYDTALSGFEEATAEGMAFEIIHEYVRSYPNDPAAIQLLNWKPYQYWSSRTTYYDSIKNNRVTGAGEFWNPGSGAVARSRYSIAATTIQMMIRENPAFMKNFMSTYFKKIRENSLWRPNRDDIMDMWQSLVPELNGHPLRDYLDTIPVFNGKKLNEGIYVLSTIRPYGEIGDQQFAVGYAISGEYCFPQDGKLWWGICEEDLSKIPDWIKTTKGEDRYYMTDMQNSKFTVEVFDANGNLYSNYDYKTAFDRNPDGTPTGLGWFEAKELAMENFALGLYKEIVTFTDFIERDQGARETFYFFWSKRF